ncbi:Nitroreductase [Halanaeroarchaeum sp. HSR-CO]|uniref:SagB/ThcOx family dehydrogenase n=1 Tax=Halanaeroarchaeum sp. HSR-CO TaxID=2866382 RepID=UPI00217DFDB3|nr:SagB/ThcOx family dehydrogenase [Halanaeroarchaeum sp. HSR-CO]UWG46804.1 Nitroreductase [Halanaeroarchaeum sp. HSR-CO]
MERRRWLRAIGAFGIWGSAGCLRSDDVDGTTPPTSEEAADGDGNGASATERRAAPSALPRPGTVEGDASVSAAIADRRSRRSYGTEPVTAAELGQLLWAAQGTTKRRTGRRDLRAAPSAGATYPLELFVVIGDPGVVEFDVGIYHYERTDHALELVEGGNHQTELQEIAVDQDHVGDAALDVVITGVDERTTQKYGERGRRRYVPIEVGHAGQNIYLQAESLGLSTVAIGAFRDDDLRTLLNVSDSHRPLCIYPVGRRW